MPIFPPRRKNLVRRRRPARAAIRLEQLEPRRVLTVGPYTFSLVDATNLDSAQYSLQVLGYSAASALTLQPSSTPGELAWTAPASSASQYGTVDGSSITGLSVTGAPSTTGIVSGAAISGPGIPNGTTVTGVSAALTLTQNVATSGTGSILVVQALNGQVTAGQPTVTALGSTGVSAGTNNLLGAGVTVSDGTVGTISGILSGNSATLSTNALGAGAQTLYTTSTFDNVVFTADSPQVTGLSGTTNLNVGAAVYRTTAATAIQTAASGQTLPTAVGLATIAVASDGQSVTSTTINVSSTTGFPASGTLLVAVQGGGFANVTYTGKTATTFTGCSTSDTGTMVTDGAVQNTLEAVSTTGFSATGGTILVMTTAGLQTVTYTSISGNSFVGCASSGGGNVISGGGVYAGSLLGNVQAISANLALSNAATASGAQLLNVSQQQAFTASGSTLTVASTAGLALGMAVTAASGIPTNTVISQITSGTQIVISNAATGASGTATFTAQVPVALGSGSTSALLGPQALPNTSPNSTSNVIVGQTVSGTGIPSNTSVSAIGAQILVSAAALETTSTSTTLNVGRNNEVQVTTVTIANGTSNVTNVGAPANAVANYLATGQQLTVNAFPVNQGVNTASTGSATTIATASGGQSVTDTIINVSSTTGFPTNGTLLVAVQGGGFANVTYTGTTGTTFTGCSTTDTGTMLSGGGVTNANTTITMSGTSALAGTVHISFSLIGYSGNLTAGSAVVTGIGSTNGLAAGYAVSGPGIPAGATIQSVDSLTQITLSTNVLAGASGSNVQLTIATPATTTGTVTNGSNSITAVSDPNLAANLVLAGSAEVILSAGLQATISGITAPTVAGATTIAAASSGQNVLTATTIHVASTAGFPPSGTLQVAIQGGGFANVTYTGTTATAFTGCSTTAGGTMLTGAAVTNAGATAAAVTVAANATASGNGYATFSLPVTAQTVAGSQWIVVTGLGSAESLSVGDLIAGPGIPAKATILAILPTITISNASTAPGITSLTFVNTQTGTASGNQLTGLSSTTGLTVGGPVSGTGIAAGTVIFSIDSPTAVTLSAAAAAESQTVTFGPASGLVTSCDVGSGGSQFASFGFTPTVQTGGLNGARIYFFVVPNDWPALATSPSNPGYLTNPAAFPYSYGATGSFSLSQGNNPPNEPTFRSSYPPFSITEITIDPYDSVAETGGGVHVDVQTVDGFSFPLSLSLQNAQQQTIGTVGQPVPAGSATRQNIITAYRTQFPTGSYADLVYGSPTAIDGQYAGLLNPGNYLYSAASASSPLNTVWDPVLGELFGAVTTTAASSNGDTLATGLTVNVASTAGFPTSGTITITTSNGTQTVPYASKTATSFTLGTLATPTGNLQTGRQIVYAPSVQLNMRGDDTAYYKGVPQTWNSDGAWYSVLEFTGYSDAAMTTAMGSIFRIFSPLTPDPLAPNYQTSSGYQVFANDGVFNDDSANVFVLQTTYNNVSPDKVVKGLERDIVSALNRGIGLLAPMNPSGVRTGGDTSLYWGTETNWYPYSITEDTTVNPTHVQNQFSLFMHTATVNGQPIFTRPTTGGPTSTVAAASQTGSSPTVTITTSAPHNLVNGQIATVKDVGTGYDGSWVIATSGPTSTSFTYTALTSGLVSASSGSVEGGAVPSAGGLLMGQAYGFAYDEDPVHGPALLQPAVPSKYDPVPAGIDTFVITAGAWSLSTSAPTVTSLSASVGPIAGGTTVIITGSDFTPESTVHFGSAAATSVIFDSSVQLTVTSPAQAAGTVNVTVTTSAGTSATSPADQFTYFNVPAPIGISPSSGPTTGGTTGVVISGTDLAGASSVIIGGTAATITGNTATSITITTPAGTVGAKNVVVITPGGSATLTGGFTYVTAPAPTGISPASGPTTGGTTGVVISGTDLADATSVTIGGTAATITGNTATSITITTPAGTVGAKDVVVTTAGGSATLTNAFTYVTAPAPTGISPASGPTTGGTTGVVISGTDLADATSVTIGGTAATITGNTATSITVTTPAGTVGAKDVVVTTAGGSATLTNAFTYVTAPAPTGISPASGPTTGGTTGVVISGTDLADATSVTIGGTAATITANTATSITITTPAGTVGAKDVVVTTAGGSATLTNAFTYVTAPAPTGISPASGPTTGGTTGVVISGTDLADATSVTIGGTAATITANTATSITITTPAGTVGAKDVVVTTAGGSATLTNAFTYVTAPAPTGISPASGPTTGGTTGVVISGTDLADATSVTIGGTAATITANTATSITITTPAGTVGAKDVVVTTAGGSATLTNAFTYVTAPAPTGISPASGPTTGGTTGVVISGTDLADATSVTIGGTAATITANTATSITITTPAGTVGAKDVVVTTAGGSATLTNAFTYVTAPAPTGISPASGPTTGGTTGVVISGTDLADATSVTIGGTAATITANTATSITITTPAGTVGAKDVVVTTAGGSATLTNAFTYVTAPAPTGISPASGPTTGGTTGVVISGTDLADATSVTIGGTAATITANTATSITITTPAGTAGAKDVVVTTAGGSATLTNAFTYVTAPAPTGISPASGPTTGGTTGVVISGTDLADATSVTIGGTAATITANTATSITITTPAGTAGAKDVVVTTAGGSATLTNAFTYVTAPAPTGISPASGPTTGGTTGVVISGTDLADATSVTIGGTAATITANTATSITITTPAGTAGAKDVVVTTAGGSATLTNAFTYVTAPAPTGISPASGPTTGGTTGVVISGTDLADATSVTIGGTAATITANTATSITITTPAGTVGAKDVVVTTAGGSATLTNAFTYVTAPAPTGISPASGPTTGGTTGVVISGTDLADATSVTIGGTAATITANTATSITITTPAGTAGAKDVVVTTAGGSATLTNAFTYVTAPAPTGISPASGPTTGGTTGVVISGTDLANATSVTIGGTAATITANTATSITITTPAGTAGAKNVVVTTAGGSATLTNAFTYVTAPAPTGISPASGPTTGGTTGVVISGTTLTNATSVTIGGTAATITANTATSITITTPAGTAGAKNVVVTTAGGSATLTNAFTYLAVPAVTGVTPNSGPTAGGIDVVITGSSFTGATAVFFGSVAATSFTVDGSTQITATVPAQAAGTVDVRVTAANGTSATGAADQFTYVSASAPTVVMPISFLSTVGVASKLIWPMPAFVDGSAVQVTATLAVSPTNVGGLVASSAAGVTVTPSGTSAGSLQFTGTVAALNAYFQNTSGLITYTPSAASLASRTLSLSATMSSGLVSRTTAAVLVRSTTPQNPPPAVNPSATINGRAGQPVVITYGQLVAATGATQTASRSIQFMLAGLTAGKLEVWTGSRWAIVPTRIRNLPLLAQGGQIRWTPPRGAAGLRQAFAVRTFDGSQMSGVSQVAVNLG